MEQVKSPSLGTPPLRTFNMGKISIITKKQKEFLDLISNNHYLSSQFYFTGGTALAEFYLHHRLSDDLDFFSKSQVDQKQIFSIISDWSKQYRFNFSSRFIEVVYRFNIIFENKTSLKVDFGYYPYPLIKKGIKYKLMAIDSLRDIATNKLLTISQRTDVKDFVDLYFLLKEKFSVWDLIYSLKAKFNIETEPFLLAEDFLKIEDFEFMPKMIKKVSLNQLKLFFRDQAKKIAGKGVEKDK